MADEYLRVTEIRKSSVVRIIHQSQSSWHTLNVAFNNRLVASEKCFDGKLIRNEAGRFVARTFYLPAESELKGWSIGQVDFVRLEINPQTVRFACEEAGRQACTVLKPATPLDDPIIWHLACVLRADLRAGCPGGVLLRDSVQNLLAQHLAIAPIGKALHQGLRPGALAPMQLRAVCDYVQANLHREIRLTELAALSRLSVFHFARAFKSVVGKSPYQYVLEQRLRASCRLLESTNLSVSEIASVTGFATGTGFTASFRRKWGVTPSAYRQSAGTAV